MGQQLNETLVPNISYWLAIDEQLDPHKFRVISYSTISETFYTCEYGTVSRCADFNSVLVNVKPKERDTITVVYGHNQTPTEQEMLSLLVFWTAKPLFLAVPAPQEPEEQDKQETLF
nr:MAG TPA: hypothetical protein [Caudoviricetes sp.]